MEEEKAEFKLFRRTDDATVAWFKPDITSAYKGCIRGDDDFDAQRIIEGIWLGSARAAFHRHCLIDYGIAHALTVARGLVDFEEHKDDGQQESTAGKSWFRTHAAVEIYDSDYEPLLDGLEEALAYIDECVAMKNSEVLVHCMAGVSRSASVVIAYLMTRKNMSFAAALQRVRSIRPIVFPNLGFQEQLRLLEECNGNINEARRRYHDARQAQTVPLQIML